MNRFTSVPSIRGRAALLLALALPAAACTGSIDAPDRKSDPPPAAGDPPTGKPPGVAKPTDPPPPPPPTQGPRATEGPIDSVPVPGTRLARLSHKQWEATVKDLLRLPAAPNLSGTFISEAAQTAFDNNGATLQVQPALWLDYQRAAEALAERVAKEPALLAKLLPAGLPAAGEARARGFIEGFGLRAYRRPLTPAEVDQYLALWNRGAELVGSGDAFADGVQVVLTLLLQSPHFLYRAELGPAAPAANGRVPLDDYQIANRLAYGLTGTMPDDGLFAAAAGKKLRTREGVLAEAKRLLGTAAARVLMDDFHYQLLHMSRYDLVSKDEKLFPEYSDGIGRDMREETRRFVRSVIADEDKGLTELLTAPYSIVNAKIAPIYGVPYQAPAPIVDPMTGMSKAADPWVRVQLDPTKRAGILTQSGFLAAFADGREPNTILRGAFINLDLLCVQMPPPPDEASALPPPAADKTNRERITLHTGPGTCGSGCHAALINPAGFAFENFDALGRWRNTDANKPVDATGSYTLDGKEVKFDGPVAFAKALAKSRQAHECYARRWQEYVHGRELEGKDEALWKQLGARSLEKGASVKALLLDLVTTDAFLTRAP
jgi:hypothetical protein